MNPYTEGMKSQELSKKNERQMMTNRLPKYMNAYCEANSQKLDLRRFTGM